MPDAFKRVLKKTAVLAYFVVLFIDLVVYICLFIYLFWDQMQIIKLYYVAIVGVVALIIFILRILIIGKRTLFDKFTEDGKSGPVLVAFISFSLSIIAVTTFIVKKPINVFVADFQKLEFSPLYWFDYLDKK